MSNAVSSSGGSVRPRFDARRRMPWAARADSENRGGALGCKMSVRVVGTAPQTDDEDPSSPLGHSEVASVEHPKRPPVPEVRQSTEERRHIAPTMAGEEARYVLEEDGGRSVSPHKGEEDEGEPGPLAGEAPSLPGDREVLAGEAAGPEVRIRNGTPAALAEPERSVPIGPTFEPCSCQAITFVGMPVPWLPAVAGPFA